MTVIEEVVVETVEAPALIIIEASVGVGELCRDAWMEFSAFLFVFDEQDLVDKYEKRVSYLVILFVGRNL